MASQPAYVDTVYTGTSPMLEQAALTEALPGSTLRGSMTFLFAIALACTSVFRERLPRPLRFGASLEGGLHPLRAMQSGHPGDYVAWLTVGIAVFSAAAVFLLR